MSSTEDFSSDIVKFIMFLLFGVLLVIMATVVAVVYITYTEGQFVTMVIMLFGVIVKLILGIPFLMVVELVMSMIVC